MHVVDPEFAKHVLVTKSTNYRRANHIQTMLPALGETLITSNGKLHALQRKQLNPEFSLGKVRHFLPTFNEKANELLKVITILSLLFAYTSGTARPLG